MTNQEIIDKTVKYVKETLAGQESGHGWWHIDRVHKTALAIGRDEGADLYIVELAALLHDIADYKFHGGDYSANERAIRQWLESLELPIKTIDQICQVVSDVSFKGAGVKSKPKSIEAQVVQDADRLDAIGAVGIARTFNFGGSMGREIYDPNIPPVNHDTFEAYKKNTSPTINHFYEKLLLLKDLMNTEAGKKLAQQRHEFMELFLEQFFAESAGDR